MPTGHQTFGMLEIEARGRSWVRTQRSAFARERGGSSPQRNACHDAGDRRVVRRPHRGCAPPLSRSARRARDRAATASKSPAENVSCDRSGPHDVHAPPRAHVVVRWRRVPVDPANRQARPRVRPDALARRGCWCPRAPSASRRARARDRRRRRLGLVGDQMPVQPHVGARDHAVDAQQRTSSRRSFGQRELGAIPPGSHEQVCRWRRAPPPHAGCRCRRRSRTCRSPAARPSRSRGRSPGTSLWWRSRRRRLRRRFAAPWRWTGSASA